MTEEQKLELEPVKKRGRRPKNKVTVAEKPTFTDQELMDFQQWKREREQKASIVANTPDDDPLRRMWKEESKLVKGIFRCREPQGGTVAFSYKKYKWDPIRRYEMTDGEVYEIPLGVARHLNQNCKYEVHSNILDANGNPTIVKNKYKSRMSFESTQFVEELPDHTPRAEVMQLA